jgi:hypothetical protein
MSRMDVAMRAAAHFAPILARNSSFETFVGLAVKANDLAGNVSMVADTARALSKGPTGGWNSLGSTGLLRLDMARWLFDLADFIQMFGHVANGVARLAPKHDDNALANDIIAAMRAAAPQDTGRLHAGITARLDGDEMEITAVARRDGGVDYAPFVQYGRRTRAPVTPGDLDRAASAAINAVDPVDFFWGPGLELLSRRRQRAADGLDRMAEEYA